jgi:outer membrane protein TolC
VAEAHWRQVDDRLAAGTASEFDLLRARVDYENRRPAVVETDNAAALAMLELKRLVNLPAEQPAVLVEELDPGSVAIDEAALHALLDRRPALRAARETIGMREAGVRIARGERFPAVHAVANLGFQAYPDGVAPPGFDAWRQDWSVSLAISWTPFDGFRTNGRIAEAQAQLRQARLDEARLSEALETGFAAAVAEYRAARARMGARRETVALAVRAHELAELRYGSGLSTQLEVTDAALQLEEARVQEVQALHDLARALARLERLTGGAARLLGEGAGGRGP